MRLWPVVSEGRPRMREKAATPLGAARRHTAYRRAGGHNEGQHYCSWRAIDQVGEGLDNLVQKRRDTKAAKRLFRKLSKGLRYAPHQLVTNRLSGYGAAHRELLPGVGQYQDKRTNNKAEVSHQPTRQQERQMCRFKSRGHAQRFLLVHGPINNLLRLGKHVMSALHYRRFRDRAFATWRAVMCPKAQRNNIEELFMIMQSSICSTIS
jgi:putative transposase